MNKYEFEDLAQQARSANLLEYFQRSGYSLKRHGAEYRVEGFGGLFVNEDTNMWFCHSSQIGGKNSIDCLVEILGHNFNQAVYELTGKDVSVLRSSDYPKKTAPQFTSPPHKKPIAEETVKELKMPERAENMRRVFAYLCKERKIPAAIVEELVHAKLLYQSREEIKTTVNGIPQTFKTCNAVFVHQNEIGEAVGGEVQGVNSYKRYKGVVAGTRDSVFMFTPKPAKDGKIKTAYLFESAIDLMSFYAFCKKEKMDGAALISMSGLKPSVPKKLREQGVKVLSCVDNDDEGRKFEAANGFKRGAAMLEKAGVKDWNDLLKMKIENPEAVKNIVTEIEGKRLLFGRKP